MADVLGVLVQIARGQAIEEIGRARLQVVEKTESTVILGAA